MNKEWDMGIITFLIVGLIAGALARLIVPGHDPMGWLGTLILGVVGSFIGGFLGYVFMGKDITDGAFQASGLIGSLLGAIIALIAYRALNHRKAV